MRHNRSYRKADDHYSTVSLPTTYLTDVISSSGMSVAASVDHAGKPLHVIITITPDTRGAPGPLEAFTITFAPGSPVTCAVNQYGAWPCLRLERWRRRGLEYLKEQLSMALYDDFDRSKELTDADLKKYKLVIAENNLLTEAEDWCLNAFDSITTLPGIFHEITKDKEQAEAYMYKIGQSRVESAQKIQDGDMFGYLVEKESGALACFFQAQHRRF